MMLDRNSPIPLYHQLSEVLLDQIRTGRLKPHEAIPTERELVERYKVSRITVRRAIAELESRGFVQREQGRGTFVLPPQVRRGTAQLTSFSEEIAERGLKPEARLLQFRREPAEGQVAQELQVQEGTLLWRIERLRLADGKIIALNCSFLHLPAHIELSKEEIRQEVSLWALLERKGIHIAEADRTIEAIAADPDQARLLQVPESAPLLLVEGVIYATGNIPVEFSRVVGRADRYKFYIHVTR